MLRSLAVPRLTALVLTALVASPAAAQSACEASFQKRGSPVTGLRFTATTAVADLSPASAINQLRGIVAAKGYDIIVAEPDAGSMLIEQPMTGSARAFPIEVSAISENGVGSVRMEAKLRATMIVKEAAARSEMCSILAQLKGGPAGFAAAHAGSGAVPTTSAPLVMSALAFSHQISKDAERNAATIKPRYTGKRFTIWGNVAHVGGEDGHYRVTFRVPAPWEEAIRLPNTAPFKTDITCSMADGTAAYTLQLKPNKSIRLTGTFDEHDRFRNVVWLKDCRPEK